MPSSDDRNPPRSTAVPTLIEQEGPWGGPRYNYRGAELWSDAAGRRWQVWIESHPLRGLSLPSRQRAMAIVDRWVDRGDLPEASNQN